MIRLPDGRALLRAVKASANSGGPALVLPVGRPAMALLRPVATDAAHLDQADVQRLTDWRNRHATSFLTEFQATPEGTADWLSRTVASKDDKILFMVDLAADGRTVGYMGLDYIDWPASYGEADAIVRGEEAPPGLMKEALLNLLRWARHSLGLERLDVRVLSDNPALAFYRKASFVERTRVPLRRVVEPDRILWVEDTAGADIARFLVRLTWKERSVA